MKIVLDVYGGDYSPAELVKGAALASMDGADYKIVVSGNEQEAREILASVPHNAARIEFLDAPDAVTNNDVPTIAIREKKNSSLVKGLYYLRDESEALGFVSAGSTGAVLSGGLLIAGRISGISRPALTVALPTVNYAQTLLLDCGANVDCKPEYLLQFAVMGACYMRTMRKIENPRIALLSVGTEDKKGNELTKAAFALLKESGLNFAGNTEARDVLTGEFDVVVADGFMGNVCLKSLEGTQKAIFAALKQEIKKGFFSTLGAGMMKPAFKRLAARLDYTKQGGAVFLGCNKIVVKTHGSSKASTVAAAIKQAAELAAAGLPARMREELGKADK